MHYTLHLTQVHSDPQRMHTTVTDMLPEIAKRVVAMVSAGDCHELVFATADAPPEPDAQAWVTLRETVAYGEAQMQDGKGYFSYRLTTDGAFLTDVQMQYACAHRISVALYWNAIHTAAWETRAKLLLSYRPYAPLLLVLTPETLPQYADAVKYLYALGFRYLFCTFDPRAAWQETDLPQLKRQYRALAALYREKSRREEKFYFSPFDGKIAAYIHRHEERCALGMHQISVSPEGKLYPCVQLMEDPYCIGDIWQGIDREKQQQLYLLNQRENAECADCALRVRCDHHCACINYCATGSITQPSPFQCAHERILIPIADSLAERLYHERNARFMQKQYNDSYPLLSLVEDGL